MLAVMMRDTTESFANTVLRQVSETQPEDDGECEDGSSCVAEKA